MELEGTLNGESITRSPSLEFGIDHAGDTYTVGDPGPESESDTVPQEVTQEVERTYGPLRTIGGPLLLVVGIVAGAGLSYARYEGSLDVSEAERAYLSYRDDRSEFDEWITRIRLPPEAHDRPVAYADSLRDLVDFAIDNETGVIEDPRHRSVPRRNRRVRLHLPATGRPDSTHRCGRTGGVGGVGGVGNGRRSGH